MYKCAYIHIMDELSKHFQYLIPQNGVHFMSRFHVAILCFILNWYCSLCLVLHKPLKVVEKYVPVRRLKVFCYNTLSCRLFNHRFRKWFVIAFPNIATVSPKQILIVSKVQQIKSYADLFVFSLRCFDLVSSHWRDVNMLIIQVASLNK